MMTATCEELSREHESNRAMTLLANVTPWTMSVLLHMAVVLVLLFTVFFTMREMAPQNLSIETQLLSENPATMRTSQPAAMSSQSLIPRSRPEPAEHQTSNAATRIPIIITTGAPSPSSMISSSTSRNGFEMTTATGGDKGIFDDTAGQTGRADNIVYVIDASGSMMLSGAMQVVREELYRALGRLSEKQSFGIIFFTGGKTLAFRKKLMRADRRNIYDAVDFAQSVQSTGPSDARDALRQAFALLQNAPKKRNLICLLSDGELKDSAKVQALLRELNPARRVHMNTILTGSRAASAIRSMKDIAENNGGSFKYVELAD